MEQPNPTVGARFSLNIPKLKEPKGENTMLCLLAFIPIVLLALILRLVINAAARAAQ